MKILRFPFFTLLLMLVTNSPVKSQETESPSFVFKQFPAQTEEDPASSDPNLLKRNIRMSKPKFFAFLGGLAAVDVAGYFRLKEIQYRSPTTSFHFLNFKKDFEKNQQMDKFAHVMHAYFVSDFSFKAYQWSGMSRNKSVLYSSLTGWLWMLQIEIADGFFERWGFSWGDLLGNTAGVTFSALQKRYPDKLNGIQLKISYHKSTAFLASRYSSANTAMLDDYEGMTFWLALNVHDLLPEKWQSKYPKWLSPVGVSVGHSARGIAEDVFGGQRELFVGLDLDFRKIPIGRDNRFLQFLKSELNFIRLPLPGFRITPSGKWFGIYF